MDGLCIDYGILVLVGFWFLGSGEKEKEELRKMKKTDRRERNNREYIYIVVVGEFIHVYIFNSSRVTEGGERKNLAFLLNGDIFISLCECLV